MKKQILAFGASNSRNSINRRLATWAAAQLGDTETMLPDLNDFEMPIYSIDRQLSTGIPRLAYRFKELIDRADGIVISFAEHNGTVTAAYKNIYDWVSRIEKDVWQQKPLLLLASSQGARGASSVLDHATKRYGHGHGSVLAAFSLPRFDRNFDESGIRDPELRDSFLNALEEFRAAL